MTRHRFDPWSLIGGAFLSVLGFIFLAATEPIGFANGIRELLGWTIPILVIVAGVALIAPALRRKEVADVLPPSEPPDFI